MLVKFFGVFIALFLLINMEGNATHTKNGVIILRSSALKENNGIISVEADWEFYWHKLLTPDSFRLKTYTPNFIHVPASWNTQRDKGKPLPIAGYATYRLMLLNPDRISDLVLKFHGISTSCNIWVNNHLVERQGHVATSREEFEEKRLNTSVHLPATDSVAIVIQVANYNYFVAGISYSVFLGFEENLETRQRNFENFEMLLCGILTMMFFYNMVFALHLRKDGRAFLFVGLMCATILFRCLIVFDGSLLLFRLLPDIDFMLVKRIEMALIYCNVFLLPMIFSHLFVDLKRSNAIRGLQVFGLALILWGLLLPGTSLGISLNVFNVGMLTSYAFSIYVLVRALLKKSLGALLLLSGTLMSLVFVAIEMLKFTGLVEITDQHIVPNLVIIGLVVFLLFQTIVVSMYFSRAFYRSLSFARSLAVRVKEQTASLQESNHIKDIMFSVISHDLRSPLNSLKGIVDLCLSAHISCDETKTLMTPLKHSLQSNTQLLDNLLFWSKLQMNNLLIRSEPVKLRAITDENIKLYTPIAETKNICLENYVSENVHVLADPDVIRLILRNLISNALKFTANGGYVNLFAEITENSIWIAVKDSGVGMSEEKTKQLFNVSATERTKLSTLGTSREKGTGLGLSICKEFIERMGSIFEVESKEGIGTTFRFSLIKAGEIKSSF